MSETLNQWYDSTTYSRNNTERKPSCWTLYTGMLRISVLSGHLYNPGKWVMHCHHLGMEAVVLTAPIETPVEEVQAAAIRIVRKRLDKMIDSLPKQTT